MSKYTMTDTDGDEFSVEIAPYLPSLMDIKMNDNEESFIVIRVDSAVEFAAMIVTAAKEATK